MRRLCSGLIVGCVLAAGLASPADADAERDPYPDGTRQHAISYASRTPSGERTRVSGLVLVPPGPAPADGWPVISWGHGTVGIGDSCAPSMIDGAYYPEALSEMLTHGYAVAATDYPGLGTPGCTPIWSPSLKPSR